uniref:Uncharacterized protein n=1 Tax=viral metagenome TaxID=1070528 RepID=A0A6M3IY04_9ZZZZ
MGQEIRQFEVWVARYFGIDDVLGMSRKENGEITIQTRATIWDRRGEFSNWAFLSWPPRRIRITVEEIDQPVNDDWGPLC